MRNIRFRAWDKEEKRMLGYDMLRMEDMFIDAGYGLVKIYQLNPNLSYTSGIQERYELMQWTGLQDKNKVPIFEGDIVRIDERGLYPVEYYTELSWDDGGSLHPGFYLKGAAHYEGDLNYHLTTIQKTCSKT